jgi:hypothetical protein
MASTASANLAMATLYVKPHQQKKTCLSLAIGSLAESDSAARSAEPLLNRTRWARFTREAWSRRPSTLTCDHELVLRPGR